MVTRQVEAMKRLSYQEAESGSSFIEKEMEVSPERTMHNISTAMHNQRPSLRSRKAQGIAVKGPRMMPT